MISTFVAVSAHLQCSAFNRRLSGVPCTSWLLYMTCPATKAVKKKITSYLDNFFGGSGDLEAEDALDISDYFVTEYGEKPHEFQRMMQDVRNRLMELDPTWYARRPELAATIPEPPGPGCVCELFLAPWHIGFRPTDSMKGKSRTVHVLGVVEDFLAEPYNSSRDPLNVLSPKGGISGHAIPAFSMRLSIGTSKSLAAKMIIWAVGKLALTSPELQLIKFSVQALFTLKCVFEPAASGIDQIKKSIGGKMQLSERPRPDPVQVAYAFKQQAREDGKDYRDAIGDYIKTFNFDSTDRKLLSDSEIQVVKLLPLQTEECQRKIEYHWQNFKIAESALPLTGLANDAWISGTKPKDADNTVWLAILAVNPDKRAATVFKRIGVFVRNLKDCRGYGGRRWRVTLLTLTCGPNRHTCWPTYSPSPPDPVHHRTRTD